MVAPAVGAPAPAPVAALSITFDNLTEVVVKLVYSGGTTPAVGETGSYDDDLYDAQGDLIGTADGTADILFQSPINGDLYSLYDQQITLPGGTVHAIGLVDVNDEIAGDWVTIAAWGTSGRYLGLVGTRSWKAISHTLADASITLYAHSRH